jgi:hypothetical protein
MSEEGGRAGVLGTHRPHLRGVFETGFLKLQETLTAKCSRALGCMGCLDSTLG